MVMRDILSRRERPTLEALAVPRVLLAFDFDGTLVPLGPRPDRARMRAVTRRLLTRLARRARCAVISGRARRDLPLPLRIGSSLRRQNRRVGSQLPQHSYCGRSAARDLW